jgi:hypothetical protein
LGHYCRALIGVGVSLHDTNDTLLWTGGDSSGIISVKNIYSALISTQRLSDLEWMEGKYMEMGPPTKDKIIHMDGSGKQDSILGRPSKKRLGGTWFLLSLQTKY